MRCIRTIALVILCVTLARADALADLASPDVLLRAAAVLEAGRAGDARAVDGLIGALTDTDPYVRGGAAWALGRLGDARAVPPLLAAAEHADPAMRRWVAEALGELGDARAIPVLIGLLALPKDTDLLARIAAQDRGAGDAAVVVHALARFGRSAVSPLGEALRTGDPETRQGAAAALAAVGDEARETLTACVTHEDAAVRRLALLALGQMGGAASATLAAALRHEDLATRRWAALAARQVETPEITDLLVKMLLAPDSAQERLLPSLPLPMRALQHPAPREAAALALGVRRDPQVSARLLDALPTANLCAARAMATVAELTPDCAGAALVVALLGHADATVRERALSAAVYLPDARVTEALLAMVTAPGRAARLGALRVLAERKDPAAIPALTVCADGAERDREVRLAALAALGAYRTADVLPPVLGALKDTDARVRAAAADALRGLTDVKAVEPLLPLLDDDDAATRAAVAEALGGIRDVRAVPALVARLPRERGEAAVAIITALGTLGDARAVDAVLPLLRSPDLPVATAAAGVLADLRAPAAVAPLLAWLKSDAFRREAAATALGRLGHREAVPALLPLLRDQEASVAVAAAEALGALGDARALEGLNTALKDGREAVAAAAARAIGRFTAAPALVEVVLRTALRTRNLPVIARNAAYYIRQGVAGAELVLLAALDDRSLLTPAERARLLATLRQCGHPLLEAATCPEDALAAAPFYDPYGYGLLGYASVEEMLLRHRYPQPAKGLATWGADKR